VVEDDDAIRGLFTRVLSRKGYQVLEAANAGEALLVREEHGEEIHLLMTDVVMPHLSGVDLAERLCAETGGLRVLYVSAHPETYLNNEHRRHLGRHFMQKPIDPARLVERVRAILDE